MHDMCVCLSAVQNGLHLTTGNVSYVFFFFLLKTAHIALSKYYIATSLFFGKLMLQGICLPNIFIDTSYNLFGRLCTGIVLVYSQFCRKKIKDGIAKKHSKLYIRLPASTSHSDPKNITPNN